MEQTKIYLGKFFWRFRLSRNLWFAHHNLSAQKALVRYLSAPANFWYSADSPHAVMMRDCVRAFIDAGAESPSDVARQLLDRVQEIRAVRYRPFFVMGFPGSGSTWLGHMLGDLPGYCYGREIGLPLGIRYWYHKLKQYEDKKQEMSDVIYAIMLLQTWHFHGFREPFDCEFINSAVSIFNYDIYKSIWPNGCFIFSVRDPRNQLLSLTYRKKNRRQRLNFKGSDLEFLKRNARDSKRIFNRYKLYQKIDNQNIYVVRYEDMKADPVKTLKKILDRFEVEADDHVVDKVVYENDSQNMRKGVVSYRGNLDEGGVAKDWQEVLTENEKRVIKPIIQELLEDFDYAKNASW